MDRLWAPWRMQYISPSAPQDLQNLAENGVEEAKKNSCIFCDKPREDRDAENLILERGATCFVILNAFPYNNGHLMVVPYRHLDDPALLTPQEQAEMMATAARMTRLIREVSRPEGFNIGMNVGSAAGAGIAAHLHLHVVPRWDGDTNFMPVIGETKVMPQTLEQVWKQFRQKIEERPQEAS